jgi:hypothetical protein
MRSTSVTLVGMALLVGCAESHAMPDAGPPDVGVECGFFANDECPAGCFERSAVRLDELPTECVDLEQENYVWCSGSPLVSFALACFVLPSGGFVMMGGIPGDYPMDAEWCEPNPWLSCGR